MGGSIGSWLTRRANSALLQRESGTWHCLGKLQAMAVTCARTSGGKTPRCPTARRVGQRMGRHPAPTPLAHRAIRGANRLGNLVVVLLRMFMDSQNDPSTKRHDL